MSTNVILFIFFFALLMAAVTLCLYVLPLVMIRPSGSENVVNLKGKTPH